MVIQINPHQMPKSAPAVIAKIDSGNIKEVNRMNIVIKRTGPQKPSFTMYVSTSTMYGSRTNLKRQKTAKSEIIETATRTMG